ncbi:hypothetical protein HK097_007361 [Rhizophlyctis rosea]|uniref:Uncharacterized protein n=1 Tax=Rhizophlyctis rosea TaxID=64517 RepID=A0AAD5SEQ2_9FUNG|nr:hypothetical protein HK097_007361 [Rhizophlyctis rosea]
MAGSASTPRLQSENIAGLASTPRLQSEIDVKDDESDEDVVWEVDEGEDAAGVALDDSGREEGDDGVGGSQPRGKRKRPVEVDRAVKILKREVGVLERWLERPAA